MFRHVPRGITLLLPLALIALLTLANVASAKKSVRVEASEFGPPNLSLLAEPRVITACEGSGAAVVHLNARATSNYPISYRWTSNAGRISGDGAAVTWDLQVFNPVTTRLTLTLIRAAATKLARHSPPLRYS